jgi:cytochrome c oxidase cbb3-type subunit 3/ubiquinol-cytochrome c reductase cytochrome c subunit
VLEFAHALRAKLRGCHGRKDAAAPQSRWPIPFIRRSRMNRDAPADRQRRARNLDAGLRPSAGGMLTDKQIDVIAKESDRAGAAREFSTGANPPSYAAKFQAMSSAAKTAFETYCESCHGQDRQGGPQGQRDYQ